MQLEDKEHQKASSICDKQEERVDRAEMGFAGVAHARYRFAAHPLCDPIRSFVSASSNSSAVGV